MKISDIELVPEGKGIFDVEIDGKLIFSKFQSGRFPDRGEIPGLISNQDSIKGIETVRLHPVAETRKVF